MSSLEKAADLFHAHAKSIIGPFPPCFICMTTHLPHYSFFAGSGCVVQKLPSLEPFPPPPDARCGGPPGLHVWDCYLLGAYFQRVFFYVSPSPVFLDVPLFYSLRRLLSREFFYLSLLPHLNFRTILFADSFCFCASALISGGSRRGLFVPVDHNPLQCSFPCEISP